MQKNHLAKQNHDKSAWNLLPSLAVKYAQPGESALLTNLIVHVIKGVAALWFIGWIF